VLLVGLEALIQSSSLGSVTTGPPKTTTLSISGHTWTQQPAEPPKWLGYWAGSEQVAVREKRDRRPRDAIFSTYSSTSCLVLHILNIIRRPYGMKRCLSPGDTFAENRAAIYTSMCMNEETYSKVKTSPLLVCVNKYPLWSYWQVPWPIRGRNRRPMESNWNFSPWRVSKVKGNDKLLCFPWRTVQHSGRFMQRQWVPIKLVVDLREPLWLYCEKTPWKNKGKLGRLR